MRIGIVAPSTPIAADVVDQVRDLAALHHPGVELVFHAQCLLAHGHFAGTDAQRAEAFIAVANDSSFDALWFARGGYGSCRIAEWVLGELGPAARDKIYLGYSDAGFVLAGLYKAGFPNVVHGPMPADIRRDGGEAAVLRALAWLEKRSVDALEPGVSGAERAAAFNITVLSQMLGTPLEPDLGGHVLLLEEVSEHRYRTDRALFHITGNAGVRRAAGIRLGRCSLVPDNDPPFGSSDEEVARYWCERSGIPYLGTADIGHDSDNKVVPFGTA
ncbi:MAG TPA: LD-carboxypeptidase [Allosphingosinicella sp.]|jgi:muramoyltetrapeptide carboxypeptidase